MKKYLLVTTDTLENIMNCFCDDDEFAGFTGDLSSMIGEVIYTGQKALRESDDEEFVSLMQLKQVFLFAMFCRDYIEVIHDLVNVAEYSEITQEQKDQLKQETQIKDLDEE